MADLKITSISSEIFNEIKLCQDRFREGYLEGLKKGLETSKEADEKLLEKLLPITYSIKREIKEGFNFISCDVSHQEKNIFMPPITKILVKTIHLKDFTFCKTIIPLHPIFKYVTLKEQDNG